ncbi:hypothetical protein BDR05DRAFT_998058 [Suillus weaverae]|nr:hypothetical protein BDR05DRAFT_998058 [Suillus weaverae]
MAATSEIPEADVQSLFNHDLPHHNIIAKKSHVSAGLTFTTTNNLPSNVSTCRQSIIDNNDSDDTFPINITTPIPPDLSHIVSISKCKASSAQDDIKLTKKSHTSEQGTKISHIAGLNKQSKIYSYGGNLCKAHSHSDDLDDDYVPPGKQGKGKCWTE